METIISKNNKGRGNITGKYYVSEKCIFCTLCSEIAPESFSANHEEGYGYVNKQPVSSLEKELCVEAMNTCPVNAIKDDGTH